MARVVGVVLSALMIVVGVIWTLQGLDVLKGSSMSGVEYWAVVGPAIAGFGIALGIVVLRGPRADAPVLTGAASLRTGSAHRSPSVAADALGYAGLTAGCPEQWRLQMNDDNTQSARRVRRTRPQAHRGGRRRRRRRGHGRRWPGRGALSSASADREAAPSPATARGTAPARRAARTRPRRGCGEEKALTGEPRKKVIAAVKAKYPKASVQRVETDPERRLRGAHHQRRQAAHRAAARASRSPAPRPALPRAVRPGGPGASRRWSRRQAGTPGPAQRVRRAAPWALPTRTGHSRRGSGQGLSRASPEATGSPVNRGNRHPRPAGVTRGRVPAR